MDTLHSREVSITRIYSVGCIVLSIPCLLQDVLDMILSTGLLTEEDVDRRKSIHKAVLVFTSDILDIFRYPVDANWVKKV